jgi:hypothetical protein
MDDAVFAQTQDLVVKLTNEVHRLRSERNALRLSVDSIGEENVTLRHSSESSTAQYESRIAEHETRVVGMNLLCEKLTEKCEKMGVICDLHILEREQLEATVSALTEDREKEVAKRTQDREAMDAMVSKLVLDRDDAVQQKEKLGKYVDLLEGELKAAHARLKDFSADAQKRQHQLALAREEVSLLRILNAQSSGSALEESLAKVYGMGAMEGGSGNKYEEVKSDLKQATAFLNRMAKKHGAADSTD